ncbi:hypothetical protein D3C72_2038160 [compost metagenome]
MRIGGAKEDEMRLLGERDVVGVTAGACEQAFVLEAAHRLAAAEARGIGFSGQRGPLVLIPGALHMPAGSAVVLRKQAVHYRFFDGSCGVVSRAIAGGTRAAALWTVPV